MLRILRAIGLSATYDYANFFVPNCQRKRLLTRSEIARLESIDMDREEAGDAAMNEILMWCLDEVERTHTEMKHFDHHLASAFRKEIFLLKDDMGEIYDHDDFPLSFYYRHFICLLAALYLPLFTAQMALTTGTAEHKLWANDLISALVVFLQNVYLLGLRNIAVKLSDPYGDDVEDLCVLTFVNEAWVESHRLYSAEKQERGQIEDEEELHRQAREQMKQDVGNVWLKSKSSKSANPRPSPAANPADLESALLEELEACDMDT